MWKWAVQAIERALNLRRRILGMFRESAEKAPGEASGRHTEPEPQRFVLWIMLEISHAMSQKAGSLLTIALATVSASAGQRPRYAPSPCSHSPSGDRSATRGQ